VHDRLWLEVLLGLQIFHVAFLALHDWMPLGRLNDVKAVRTENPRGKLLLGTVISTAPFAVGLAASWRHLHGPYPGWLWYLLWIAYVLLFVGELEAWWIPYLRGTSAERVERYKAMFGKTLAFLPEHHGIVPNALHVVLHIATLATLIVLGILTL
jgi:hypothetical protein